jgi:hypothetical protein
MPGKVWTPPLGLITGWKDWNAGFITGGWIVIPSKEEAAAIIEKHNSFDDKPFRIDTRRDDETEDWPKRLHG